MRVLGVITARGGSKGIPRKNLALLDGKPLLAYTVETALGSQRLTRVVLSTEDAEIAECGRRLGVEVPFLRPAELATDMTPSIDVLQDTVKRLTAAGESYDAVLTLQPTSPLRTVEDIDGAIELMERTGCESVISFALSGRHPGRMKTIDEQGRVHNPPFAEEAEGIPRQKLPRYYRRDGGIYLTRTEVLTEQRSIQGKDCRAWLVPEWRACDIDTRFDLFFAEQVLRHYEELKKLFSAEEPQFGRSAVHAHEG